MLKILFEPLTVNSRFPTVTTQAWSPSLQIHIALYVVLKPCEFEISSTNRSRVIGCFVYSIPCKILRQSQTKYIGQNGIIINHQSGSLPGLPAPTPTLQCWDLSSALPNIAKWGRRRARTLDGGVYSDYKKSLKKHCKMGEGTRAWNGKDWLEIESKCREQHIMDVWVILEGYIKY